MANPEIAEVCQKYFEDSQIKDQDSQEYWNCISKIPDDELWQVRQGLKSRLITAIQDRAQTALDSGSGYDAAGHRYGVAS